MTEEHFGPQSIELKPDMSNINAETSKPAILTEPITLEPRPITPASLEVVEDIIDPKAQQALKEAIAFFERADMAHLGLENAIAVANGMADFALAAPKGKSGRPVLEQVGWETSAQLIQRDAVPEPSFHRENESKFAEPEHQIVSETPLASFISVSDIDDFIDIRSRADSFERRRFVVRFFFSLSS